MSLDIEHRTKPTRTSAAEAARRLKTGAAQAADSGRERLGEARQKARALARTTGRQVTGAGRQAASQARQRPVSTGLLVAGAVAGAAVLLSPRLRRLAIAAGPFAWKFVQSRRPHA